ncbi:MAG: aldo/keto reductase [Caldilineaceae bacterium]
MLLQSKCGIRRACSTSRDHILSGQWRASLRRLQTDYLDVLLLHRPDTLVEPEEVADAFSQLHRAARCAISASAT